MSSHVLVQQNVSPRLPRRPTMLWPLATLPFSGAAVLAVNTGGEALRWLMLGGLTSAMALPLLISLEAGLMAMMLFEPLRGLIRRAQYLFLPYTQSDPIHVVTPVVTILAFLMVLHRHRLTVFYEAPLSRLVSTLGAIYFLQIFNPLQGGLSIGLSGAMFVLVPVVWFYFGQTVKPEFMTKTLRVVVVLGLITSLYGLYHLAYGFPSFEQYWLDNTDAYESIALGQIKRALATYSSAEEWGRYIEIGAIVAFGFGAGAIGYLRRGGWYLCGGVLTVMLLFTGQRTAIFGLILGALTLFAIGAKTWRGIAGRVMLVLAPLLIVGALVKAPTGDDVWSLNEDERFHAALSHSARGALQPTKEDSLQERFDIWTRLATDIVPNNPFGMGLGATSLAAFRSEGSKALPPVDSYFISSVITCGLPAALLFIWILSRATLMSWRSFRSATRGTADAQMWRVVAAVMPALLLNSFFGNTFSLYSVAPIGWLLIGWIGAEQQRRVSERDLIQI